MDRTFTTADQDKFAAYSGDYNPIHMDPLFSRRTQAGAPVVHGMHIFLWAIEAALCSDMQPKPLCSLRVRFPAPVLVGDQVKIHFKKENDNSLTAKIRVEQALRCKVDLYSKQSMFPLPTLQPMGTTAIKIQHHDEPQAPSFERMKTYCGQFLLTPNASSTICFPHIEAKIGQLRLRAISALSAIVGMVCPGLHSLFGSAEIALDGPETPWIDFKVVESDDRFRRIVHEFVGGGIRGRVEAFNRMPPVEQLSASKIQSLVGKNEFAGSVALVVGGSRGLGALTAKLLTAGGAHVLLTYVVGTNDARQVQQEIQAAGSSCEIMMLDVLSGACKLSATFPKPTHVYYFATPKISLPPSNETFSRKRFDYFSAFYLDGLYKLASSLMDGALKPIHLFNPSSIYVEERPAGLTEYAMAKAASEILGEELTRLWPNFHVSTYRLPRLLTDQTVTVSPVKMDSAVDVILPLVRQFQNLGSGLID